MKRSLEEASRLIKADKRLAEFTVSLDGEELHLVKEDESFPA